MRKFEATCRHRGSHLGHNLFRKHSTPVAHSHCDPGKLCPGHKFARNNSNVHNIDQNTHAYEYNCDVLVTFFSRSIVWDSIFLHRLFYNARRARCTHFQGLMIKIVIFYRAIMRGRSRIKISVGTRVNVLCNTHSILLSGVNYCSLDKLCCKLSRFTLRRHFYSEF
jgi:hypothetical protein